MNKFVSVIFGILACVGLFALNAQARPQLNILSSLASSAATAVSTAADTAAGLADGLTGSSNTNATGTVAIGMEGIENANEAMQNVAEAAFDEALKVRDTFQSMGQSWATFMAKMLGKAATSQVTSTLNG